MSNKGFCLPIPGLSIRDNFCAYGEVVPTWQSPFLQDEARDWEGDYSIDIILGDPAYNYCHSVHGSYYKAAKALRALANEYGSVLKEC